VIKTNGSDLSKELYVQKKLSKEITPKNIIYGVRISMNVSEMRKQDKDTVFY
jgi:hypothetical protein